jgi:hypothetical protein
MVTVEKILTGFMIGSLLDVMAGGREKKEWSECKVKRVSVLV